MNIFASIEYISDFTYEKVKYYSVRFENKEYSEFEDFLNRMENERDYEDDLNNLFVWLECIGEKYGAKERFFRPEKVAQALPPPLREQKLHTLEVNDIRLYCLRLNESVVLLFNGGIKTKNKAQDCLFVGPYFKEANILASKINQFLRDKDIQWNGDYSDICYDDDLRIEL